MYVSKHRTVVRKFIENTQTNDLHVATLCHGYHGISIYNLKQGEQVSNLIVDNLEYVLQFPLFWCFQCHNLPIYILAFKNTKCILLTLTQLPWKKKRFLRPKVDFEQNLKMFCTCSSGTVLDT